MRSFCVTHREFNGELCDNPEGWDGVRRGRLQKEGTYVYLRLIHIVVWQKPTQYCKAIILHLIIDFLKIKQTKFQSRSSCYKGHYGDNPCEGQGRGGGEA